MRRDSLFDLAPVHVPKQEDSEEREAMLVFEEKKGDSPEARARVKQ